MAKVLDGANGKAAGAHSGVLRPASKATPAKALGATSAEDDDRRRQKEAAAAVRSIIQKVRLATPDTFSDVTVELSDALVLHASDLQDEQSKLQDEADKAIEFGQKRIDQLLEKKQKEDEEAEQPRELLKIYSDLVQDFEAKVAKCRADWAPGCIVASIGPLIEEQLQEHYAEFQNFTQEVQKWMKAHAVEFSKPAQLEVVKKEHQVVNTKAGALIRESTELRRTTQEEKNRVVAAAKGELLAAAKGELAPKLEGLSVPVSNAEMLVKHMEKTVEPFAKILLPDDMGDLAGQVESAIDLAKESVVTARKAVCPIDDIVVEDSLREEVQAWLQGETKRYAIRLGQLDRRIARASQLVTLWRREVKQREDARVLASLKDTVVDKAKAITPAEVLEPLEPVLQETEDICSILVVGWRGKKPEDLRKMEALAKDAIASAQEAMKVARAKLHPFDDKLGEKVKQELEVLIAPFIRSHEFRLDQTGRRVQRMEKVLENFQAEMRKINAIRCQKVKAAVTRLLRIAAKSDEEVHLSPEDLFNHIDRNRNGSISEAEWTRFLQGAKDIVRGMEVDKSLIPMLELSTGDFSIVFDDLAFNQPGSSKVIGKAAFLKLLPQFYQVVRATTMTAGINIATSKTIRQLRPGENVEVLDGPGRDPNLDVDRIQVRALEDSVVGWATIIGNGGSAFLKETTKPPPPRN